MGLVLPMLAYQSAMLIAGAVRLLWDHERRWRRWVLLVVLCAFAPIIQLSELAYAFLIKYVIEPPKPQERREY